MEEMFGFLVAWQGFGYWDVVREEDLDIREIWNTLADIRTMFDTKVCKL